MPAANAQPSDDELITRAQATPESFAQLYQRYAQRIYSYFYFRVGHQADVAEDLMQETFMRAFRALGKFQSRGVSYLAYLQRIAHNGLVNYYRRPQALPLEAADALPDTLVMPQDSTEAHVLWGEVQQLGQTDKDAVLLRYQDELSIREIAAVMDKSENAVKLILSRVRKKLAQHRRLNDLRHLGPVQLPPGAARFYPAGRNK